MGTLRYGASVRDITPTERVMLHGYANRMKPSTGIDEPICLGCLALEKDDTRVLILTADMVGAHSYAADEIRSEVSKATGVPRDNVILSCSHTHFAPQISFAAFTDPNIGIHEPEESVYQRFHRAAVETAEESLRTMVPCRMEVLRTLVPSVSFNRRTVNRKGDVETNFRFPVDSDEYTYSPTDDELVALRFKADSGAGAVLVNFACHPVTGGFDNEEHRYHVSSDYIHYLRRTLEAAWGYLLFFTLGAAGDAVPRDRFRDSRKRIGSILGESIVLADRMFSYAGDDPALAVRNVTKTVETILPVDRERHAEEYEKTREAALAAKEKNDDSGTAHEEFVEAIRRYFKSRLYPSGTYEVEVSFVRLGPVLFVTLPFEVLSELSIRMKERFPDTVLLSCTNGYQGYLPFRYEYDRGGYEATQSSTHFKEGTTDELFDLICSEIGKDG